MAKIRALLGKVRIEYFAIGLFLLTLVVFSSRLYVCRLDGVIVMQQYYGSFPLGFGTILRALILDACFATIGFMVFDRGYSKMAKLVFRIGFCVAVAAWILNLLVIVTDATSDVDVYATYFLGRAVSPDGTQVLIGGFGIGFYLHILLLLAYGVAVFLYPGYAGTDEPTLYGYVLRRIKKPDPLLRMDAVGDPDLVRNVPLAAFYTIISFGVYYLVWMYGLIKAMHKLTNDASTPTKDFLLSIFVLPGFQIMFALKLKKWEEYLFAHRADLHVQKSDYSLPYLLLTIFGLGPVAVLMMQLDLNKAGSLRAAPSANAEAQA